MYKRKHTQHINSFKDVKARFPAATLGAVTIELEKDIYLTYGIPGNIGFNVMYVRTDVVDKYNLAIPTKWDDLYDLIPVLQKYKMNISPPDVPTLVYQAGGTQYKNNGRQVNFDSDLYLEMFTKVNALYGRVCCNFLSS